MCKIFALSMVLLILIKYVESEPLVLDSPVEEPIFVYPSGSQSERDLYTCPENSACNIIYRRFWLPPLIERLCRCPQRRECPSTWSSKPNNYTMTLDNRSQFQFCSDLSELPACVIKKPAIRIVVQPSKSKVNTTTTVRQRHSQKRLRQTEQRNVTSLCNCQDPHYWKLRANSTKYDKETNRTQQMYVCSKLKKCSRMEFCGFVRTDTFSTFYRCSCPKGHYCISRDKNVFKAEEMLYNGTAYKAFCFPLPN